jgi:glycosyltransferase involved in cell wall biosynthesis
MKNILFLPSWFPNRTDPFSGDFIKRHAISASLYNRITVFHTVLDPSITEPEFSEEKLNDNLSIHIFYYPTTGKSFSGSINGFKRFNALKKMYASMFSEKSPDIVHVHVSYPAGLFALYLNKIKGLTYILSEHNTIYMPGYDNSYIQSSFERKMNPVIFKNAKKIHVVSKGLGKALENSGLAKSPIIIPNVVDTDNFKYLPKPDENVFRFIHVSLLVNQKNPEGMLAALVLVKEKRSDFVLKIVGPGNDKIKKLVEELSLNEHIIFTGEIPYEKVAEEVSKSDAMIHFARFETFGCVVAESLCCGVPVITSDIDVMKELISNNVNGLLVKENDINDLASKILFLMNSGITFDSKKIAEESKALFNYRQVGNMLDELYQSVS